MQPRDAGAGGGAGVSREEKVKHQTGLHKDQLNLKCKLISCTFQVFLSVKEFVLDT